MGRTLVAGGWNKAKDEEHFDMLNGTRKRLHQAASISAINVGSAEAGPSSGFAPRIGELKAAQVRLLRLSQERLLAALTDVHMAPMPPYMEPASCYSQLFSVADHNVGRV